MKKLKKQLNKLLPKGMKVAENPTLSLEKSSMFSERRALYFDIEKTLTKEQLLEKAKKDYPEGTVFKCSWPGHSVHEKNEHVSTGKLHWWKPYNYTGNYPFGKEGLYTDNGYVWTEKYGWAKIIKKPVFKIDDTFMYEGDEYWDIDTELNWKLYNNKIKKGTIEINFVDTIKAFTTKQSALDFVLAEAKKRFEGCKETIFFNDVTDVRKLNNEGLYISEYSNNLARIGDYSYNVWIQEDGFLAKPVKEQTKSVWLVQHKESLIVHGCFTNEEKAEKYCKGDFAIIKIDVA